MAKFYAQWHITASCDQRCKQCYMFDSPTYKDEIKNQQDFQGFKKIFNNFLDFCHKLNVEPHIVFTGGDPLLHSECMLFFKYCFENKVPFSILGNPYHLNQKNVDLLKKYGITSYQMSLDGLEKTHDFFRKKGSFNETIKKFNLLKENNIKSVCMFTLSKINKDELIPLINFINNKVDVFDFSRLVPTGSGSKLKDEMINSKEYRQLLLNILDQYLNFVETNTSTTFGRKDHLWKLLYSELGLLNIFPKEDIVYDGCHAGITHITILSDGKILLCRRLPIILGNALYDSIYDVFIYNSKINKFRKVEKRKKCKNCELLRFCRGCPAIGWALTGDMFAEDPQCWK